MSMSASTTAARRFSRQAGLDQELDMSKSKRQAKASEIATPVTKTTRRPKGEKVTTMQAATPDTKAASVPNTSRPPSIRSTIIEAIQAGRETAEIAQILQDRFPGSKAAEKAPKHISFYRSRLKKAATIVQKA